MLGCHREVASVHSLLAMIGNTRDDGGESVLAFPGWQVGDVIAKSDYILVAAALTKASLGLVGAKELARVSTPRHVTRGLGVVKESSTWRYGSSRPRYERYDPDICC